jgi:ferredoxin-NADP reductase
MMRAVSGSPPRNAQASLKDSWKVRGYFLACVCVPDGDLEVASPGADFRFKAVISGLRPLSKDVIEASLVADDGMEFRAGQYVTVVREDGLARSYSIASLPSEATVQLHIRRIPNGRMSNWFHDEARSGDSVTLLGPSGECFYVTGREDQPLLLAGTGTGLAPLYGILRDALQRGHRGPIQLFHGALHQGGLYLTDELRALARQYAHLEYSPTVLRGDGDAINDGVVVGAMDQIIATRLPDLTGWRGFVCGDPNLVLDLKKKLFLAGMASREIHADAFIPAASS